MGTAVADIVKFPCKNPLTQEEVDRKLDPVKTDESPHITILRNGMELSLPIPRPLSDAPDPLDAA
jgi:hypothetical protein